jgi:hypothetical protein
LNINVLLFGLTTLSGDRLGYMPDKNDLSYGSALERKIDALGSSASK